MTKELVLTQGELLDEIHFDEGIVLTYNPIGMLCKDSDGFYFYNNSNIGNDYIYAEDTLETLIERLIGEFSNMKIQLVSDGIA